MPLFIYLKIAAATVLVTAVVIGALWLHDAIGDKREAKVRAEYAAATADLNERIIIQSAREEAFAQKEALDMDAATKEALKQFSSMPGRWVVSDEEAAVFKQMVRP